MLKLRMVIGLVCLHLMAYSQDIDQRLVGLELDIDSLMSANNAVGVSIAVVYKDKVVYSKGFGYRNLNDKLPVTPNTVFGIGSITKQFTAGLIGIYEGQGKLSLYDKPNQHIKNLKFSTTEMNALVTIEDLLCHRSGIGSVDGCSVFFPTNDIHKHINRLAYLKPSSNVREGFHYSNMGFEILGAIGEEITSQTWGENIKKDILIPLQMKNTNTTLDELFASNDFSFGYSTNNGEPVKVILADQYEASASGAINSSANDMAKWMLMLLNGGEYKNKVIIPKSYLESSFSNHNIIAPSFSFDKQNDISFFNYGYGWFTKNYKEYYSVGHAGSVSGYTANIELFPHEKLGIIVLTNQDKSNLFSAIINIITNRMLNVDLKQWNEYEVRTSEIRNFLEPLVGLNDEDLPSYDLVDYKGKYRHQGYGVVEVEYKENHLLIHFPAFTMGLVHLEGNSFYCRLISELHQNTPSFNVNFSIDETGVHALDINMQAEPILFKKLN